MAVGWGGGGGAFPSIIQLLPFKETAEDYINSLQLIIITVKCDWEDRACGEEAVFEQGRAGRSAANESRPTGCGTWPSHYARTSRF